MSRVLHQVVGSLEVKIKGFSFQPRIRIRDVRRRNLQKQIYVGDVILRVTSQAIKVFIKRKSYFH